MNNKWLAAATLGVVSLLAQGPGGAGRPGGPPRNPEQMIQRRIQFLTTQLTLTPSQVTQATMIFTDEQQASEALRTSIHSVNKALQDAVKANATEPQIEAAAAEVGRLQGQSSGVHAKAQAKFRATLTVDQRAKLDSLGEGPGGPGGMGPGPRRGGRF